VHASAEQLVRRLDSERKCSVQDEGLQTQCDHLQGGRKNSVSPNLPYIPLQQYVETDDNFEFSNNQAALNDNNNNNTLQDNLDSTKQQYFPER